MPQGEAGDAQATPQAVSKRSVLAIGAALAALAGGAAGPARAEPAITQKVWTSLDVLTMHSECGLY